MPMTQAAPRAPDPPAAAFTTFLTTRQFPALDGLRAMAVLLVITVHVHTGAWKPLAGEQGVTAFFVLSGFLITTLLLREQTATGRISLRGFYVRRAFRILPLYVLVLAVYVVAILVLGVEADKRAGLEHALPYYLTFTNEIAIHGDAFRNATPFYQSWSLGVEEKFYVLWPVLGFLVLRRAGGRVAGLAGAAVVVCALQLAVRPLWARWYEPIVIGCLLGALLHRERSFARLALLGRTGWSLVFAAVLVAMPVLFASAPRLGELLYPFAVAGLLVCLVTGASPLRRALGGRFVARAGRRAYGVYLVHILVIGVVDKAVLPDDAVTARTVANLLLAVAASFAVADALHRVVEAPAIAAGRRLSRRLGARTAPGTVSAAPATIAR